MSGKNAFPFGVIFLLVFVDATIHFDHKFRGMAEEVSDEAADDLLPTEVKPVRADWPAGIATKCSRKASSRAAFAAQVVSPAHDCP